jgi:hypothetical protein
MYILGIDLAHVTGFEVKGSTCLEYVSAIMPFIAMDKGRIGYVGPEEVTIDVGAFTAGALSDYGTINIREERSG